MTQNKIELSIVVRDGEGREKSYSFAKNRVLIGRTISCDIPLEEAGAGKEHARIEVSSEGAIRLRDLGTSAGTLLNGNRVEDMILLSDGDEVRIGSTNLQVGVKSLSAGLVATEKGGGGRWKTYEMPHRPVLNIAQLWGDAVIAVRRFGKSSKHVLHTIFFSIAVLAVEAWFTYEYYLSLHGFYLKGKMADYGPQLTTVILCFVVADILIFLMVRDLFIWPRYFQSKTVRVGQSRRADFFVPSDVLGKKVYDLIVRFRGRPALNLKNQAVTGKVLVDGQILSIAELKKTSLVKEKFYLPLNYKIRARLEVGHATFILGLDPALREPKGAILSRINVPILASFGLAFFINALFLLALMAAPRTEPVVRISSSHSRSFKTLIRAEKRKREEKKDKKKKVEIKKKEEKKEEKKEDKDKALDDEVDKAPLLEEKIKKEEKRVITRKIELKPAKKSLTSDLQLKKKKKKLSSMTTPVSKKKVRSAGALGALQNAGMKVMGSNFGSGDLNIDSSFAPVGDLAITGLGDGSGVDVGGSADSDPFDLSNVAGSTVSLDGESGPIAGGFNASVGADGAAIRGETLISGKDFDELRKKKVSSSVKSHKLKDKAVKITPSAKFGMSGGGKLDREVVKKYIRKQLAKIRWCYQKAFQKNPNLEGKVTVSFIISPTGSVMSSKVSKSTLRDKELEKCIEQKILTWRFPAPKGGGVVKVNYPFVLRKQ